MEEHTLREGESGTRPTRSARLERKKRASSLPPSKPCLVIVTSLRRLWTRRAVIPQAKGTSPRVASLLASPSR